MGKFIYANQLDDYTREEEQPIKSKKQHKVKKFKKQKDK